MPRLAENVSAPEWHNAKWRADFATLDIRSGESTNNLVATRHRWIVCESFTGDDLPLNIPGREQLQIILARKGKSSADLLNVSVMGDLPNGARVCWTFLDIAASTFIQLTALRKGIALLLEETPVELAFQVNATKNHHEQLTRHALRCILINQVQLDWKNDNNKHRALRVIRCDAHISESLVKEEKALAEGNTITRWLTGMPRSALYPASYRAFCEHEAKRLGWDCRVYRFAELQIMGAGAFVSVAQGSDDDEACIVHLRYTPDSPIKKKFSLVGKGVCMDTGGYNVKSDVDMQNMNEDMSGSAVALSLITAISQLKLPWEVDAWLAIAENRIGPNAYTPQDVVTSLSGTSIEIIHTDSEGRLLLADALTLARRHATDACLIDFGTLTGAMVRALGNRMSGVFTNAPGLAGLALEAATHSGERTAVFPLEADYDDDLASDIADTKHTNFKVGGGAILAARFLQKFAGEQPWVHVDLSSWKHSRGLGAVCSDLTGFGVYWAYSFMDGYDN
jgi:leucyl aminopeptidase